VPARVPLSKSPPLFVVVVVVVVVIVVVTFILGVGVGVVVVVVGGAGGWRHIGDSEVGDVEGSCL